MKKLLLAIFFLSLSSGIIFAQTQQNDAPEKKGQIDRLNEIYVSYGIGSLYYIVDQSSSNSYSSPGTFIVGYTRTLNKVIGIGFQLGFTPVTIQYATGSSDSRETDNYIQGLARIKFQYLNRPVFAMYSGIAIGVAMDYYSETLKNGTTKNIQKYFPAGQFTLLGFRIGRGAAFCGEFGIGTLSFLNLGVSFKFGE